MAADESKAVDPRHDFVLLQGVRTTRGALDRWSAAPGPVLGPWFGAALAVSVGLLGATWLVASLQTPDPSPIVIAGISTSAGVGQFAEIMGANLLVLALHATACVAGFIAGSSLPLAAQDMTGFKRFVHEKAGPLAIWWVIAVTTFSLVSQAYGLGITASSLAADFQISPFELILTVLPHALLELTAVFLPLAAWLIASRRGEWSDLLAATFVTVAIALPMLLLSTTIELELWPRLLQSVSPGP